MSSIGNTAIKEIALGSTQIAEVYLGSALVFRKASPLVIPANTLLVRFGNANYDPAAAAQSNGNGHGTWTKVASAHNDWLWTYNNSNWQYWCGATAADKTAILTDSGDISILDHGDISAVTNISNMFDNIGYRIVAIAKFVTGTGITTAYRFAAGIYRVTDYSFISTIGSGATSVNLNQMIFLYTNWVSLKYNYGTVNEGSFPDPFAKTLASGGKVSSFQYIMAFRNFTGAYPMPTNSVLASGASGAQAFLGCTKGGALPSSWPSNLTGNCANMFSCCFNATGVAAAATAANSAISTTSNKSRMFSLAGINNSTERTALKSANTNVGGGSTQYFYIFSRPEQFGNLTGGSNANGYYCIETLFPASLNRTQPSGAIRLNAAMYYPSSPGSTMLVDTGSALVYRSNFYGFPGSSNDNRRFSSLGSVAGYGFFAFFQLESNYNITTSDLASHVSWVLAARNDYGDFAASANSILASGFSTTKAFSFIRGQENFDESRSVYAVFGLTLDSADPSNFDKWFIGKYAYYRSTQYTTTYGRSWYPADNAIMYINSATFNT